MGSEKEKVERGEEKLEYIFYDLSTIMQICEK
jgi:hypothetical protein